MHFFYHSKCKLILIEVCIFFPFFLKNYKHTTYTFKSRSSVPISWLPWIARIKGLLAEKTRLFFFTPLCSLGMHPLLVPNPIWYSLLIWKQTLWNIIGMGWSYVSSAGKKFIDLHEQHKNHRWPFCASCICLQIDQMQLQ